MELSREYKGDEANYCTIELVSGRLLQVDCSPAEMLEHLQRAGRQSLEWVDIEVMRVETKDSLYRNPVKVSPESVMAIYPLDTVPGRG